jgi:phage I-like protein
LNNSSTRASFSRMAVRLLSHVLSSALDVEADQPLPTAFLIFRPGVNATRKGDFMYDEAAAAEVLAEYQAGGVQLCLDLEHDSLDPKKRTARADAADAMGWYDLEQRSDGSLWAINVRWSSEGERRLRGKLQRYTSPAFLTLEDENGERPTRLINVALCAMPATLDATPLVAASEGLPACLLALAKSSANSQIMKPIKKKVPTPTSVQLTFTAEEAKKAVDIIATEDKEAAFALVKEILTSAASGGEAAAPAPEGGDAAPELADPTVAPEGAPVVDEKKAEATALSMLSTLTGVTDPREVVTRFRAMSDALAASDLEARKDLVGKLVVLGRETPASAWEGNPEARKPKARFLSEPIAELRDRVAMFEKTPLSTASNAPATKQGETPKGGKVVTLTDGTEVTLSVSELEACTEYKTTPEAYAQNKHTRESARKAR